MSKRVLTLILGCLSLCFGLILYLLFRENTYITKAIEYILPLANIRPYTATWANAFTQYYLPDFLWSFSLSSLSTAFCAHSQKETILFCFLGAFCGIFWEFSQWVGLFNGTGDCLDIIMYFLGSCLCLLINLKEKKT